MLLCTLTAFAAASPRAPPLLRGLLRGTPLASPSERNGEDADYPWLFRGRLWFRPAVVRSPPAGALPDGVRALSLFGWSIGGVVALEYDESPVGPYLEYVSMGALVSKRGTVGQWGSRLYVSNAEAERACVRVWGVPATAAAIEFEEGGGALCVERPPESAAAPQIEVSGWSSARSAAEGAPARGGLPVLWTPTLKALWAPLVPLPARAGAEELPLHRLRLSAASLKLQLCGQAPSEALGLPLPLGLSVDNVLIEISEPLAEGL